MTSNENEHAESLEKQLYVAKNVVKHLLSKYIEATEYELATLGHLLMLKSSSKSEIRRHFEIARRMLLDVYNYYGWDNIEPSMRQSTRVRNLMDSEDNIVDALFNECVRMAQDRHDVADIVDYRSQDER